MKESGARSWEDRGQWNNGPQWNEKGLVVCYSLTHQLRQWRVFRVLAFLGTR